MCLSPGGLARRVLGGGANSAHDLGCRGSARVGWDELVSMAGPTPRRADYSVLGAQVLSHGT